MMTKTMIITKAAQVITNRGRKVFNDRLLDGTRSLKVWGWTDIEYEVCRKLLVQAGLAVTVKYVRSGYPSGQRSTIRLHVKE
jgi:hypothetical protein